ncbi:hypothetical protein K443DRAFT_3919 [Laccaria amethystina LaAM-08-1]|uniref:Uncharacterized protein n=1 Tax=Laccaria amethystina LaAM-08-1 TaxID=1095629 RepID=A0A0C9X043_9AGAR|nr:hypothetical protein K443DRAFT_3919 [Laccaria amethystina LaAM-08-1]
MAKKKSKPNITGLQNQSNPVPSHVESTDATPQISGVLDAQIKQVDLDEEEWCPNLQFDSSKPNWDASDTEDDIDSEDKQDYLDKKEQPQPGVNIRRYRNNGLYVAVMHSAIQAGDDLRDEDWVTRETRKKLCREKKAPSNEYSKGPDVGSKSK